MLQYLTTELTDLDKAEADLISSTRANLAKFTDVEVVWVKGHQDDNTPYDDLPLLAQLNVDCDTAAKKHLREGTHPTSRPAPLPDAKATLFFGTNMVTTEINEQIQYAAQAPKLFEYLREKFDWIDTPGLGRAKKCLTRVRSIRTTKWIFGWFNIGAQKQKWERTAHVHAVAWSKKIKCTFFAALTNRWKLSLTLNSANFKSLSFRTALLHQLSQPSSMSCADAYTSRH